MAYDQLDKQAEQIKQLERWAAFLRCCALSGEIPMYETREEFESAEAESAEGRESVSNDRPQDRREITIDLLCQLVRLTVPNRRHGCLCDDCLREEILSAKAEEAAEGSDDVDQPN